MNKTYCPYKLLRYGLLLLTCIASYGLCRLQLNDDVLQLLPDIPSLRGLKQYNDVFASLSRFSITLVNHAADDNKLIPAAERAAQLLARNRYFEGVRANFAFFRNSQLKKTFDTQIPNLLEAEDFEHLKVRTTENYIRRRIGEIFEQQVGIAPDITNVRLDPLQFSHIFWKKFANLRTAMRGTIDSGYLLTQNRKALLLDVPALSTKLSHRQAVACWRFLQNTRQRIADEFPGIEMVCIGGRRVELDNQQAIRRDIAWTSSWVSILLIALFALILRNFFIFPLLFLPSAFGVAIGLGVSSLLAPQISWLTLGYGAVLIGISVDYVIHYIMHLQAKGATASNPHAVMCHLFQPMSYAMISTCGALAILVVTDFPAYQEIGWFAGSGLVGSFLFVVAVFPQICRYVYANNHKGRQAWLNLPKIIARLDQRHPGILLSASVIAVTVAMTIFSWLNLEKLQFSSDMEQFSYHKPATQRDESAFFAIWGDQRGKVVIVAGGDSLSQALHHNASLYHLLRQAEREQQLTIVSLATHLLPSEQTMHTSHRLWKEYWTPSRRQQVKQTLQTVCREYGFSGKAFQPFLQQLSSPPPVQPISAWWPQAIFADVFRENIRQHGDRWYVQNIIQAKDSKVMSWLARQIERDHPQTMVIDRRAIVGDTDALLKRETQEIFIMAVVLILVLFWLYFVHWETMIIALLPLALSLLWTLGIMSYFAIPLNIFNTLVIIFILGLGIDYVIFHLIANIETIGQAYDTAVARSSIVLSGGTTVFAFGALAIAKHPALHSLGLCAAIGMSVALFNALFLTPILFRYIVPCQRKSHPIRVYHLISSFWAFGWFIGNIILLSTVVFPIVALWQKIRGIRDRQPYLRLIEAINKTLLVTNPLGKIHYLNFPPRKNIQGTIAVVNHLNAADVPLFNSLPFAKITMVKWFDRFIFVRSLLRRAGFISLSPAQHQREPEWQCYGKKYLEAGGNILFFPEGTRAKSLRMSRFRVGAFHLACATKAPILPICFFNSRWVISRGRLIVRDYEMYASALPMLNSENFDYAQGPRKLAGHVKQLIADEYERIAQENACKPRQVRLVCDCYRYISVCFDMYLFFKLATDKNYSSLPRLLPRTGNILDIGCGAGFLSNLMVYSAENRQVLGLDYDEEKIRLARRSLVSYTRQAIDFMHGDILEYAIEPGSFAGVMCCDVLHYFPVSQQQQVLLRAWQALQPGGTLVMRQDVVEKDYACQRAWFESWGTFMNFNRFQQGLPAYPNVQTILTWLIQIGFTNIRCPLNLQMAQDQLLVIAEKPT